MSLSKIMLSKLASELLLLSLVACWVLLRLASIIVKKVENEKNLRVEVFGKELIEVVSSNSALRRGEKNIQGKEVEGKNNHTLLEKGKILLLVA